MSNSTTPAVARRECAPSVFSPGGATWVPVPVGLDGPALHAWMALMRCRRGTIVTAPDRVLAGLARRSPRTIQAGLRQLEADGLIVRTRRHGDRVVTIVGRLAGSTRLYENPRGVDPCTDSQPTPKPYRSPHAAPIRNPLPAPSFRGETPKKQPVPPVAASTPVGPVESHEPPCPAFTRFFARVCPAPG